MTAPRRRRARAIVTAVALTLAEAAWVARRRGFVFGAATIVRCRQGHLFTTIWIPGVSFKAVRLGPWRFERCPVGKHWSLVTPVKASALTSEERRFAAEHPAGVLP